MKKFVLAATAVVGLMAAACVPSESERETTPTTSSTTPRQYIETHTPETSASSTTVEAEPAADYEFDSEEFHEVVLKSVFEDEGIYLPDGASIQYAKVVCEGLDDGLDLGTIVAIGASHGPVSDLMDNAFMVGASVGTVCPEYSLEVDNYGK